MLPRRNAVDPVSTALPLRPIHRGICALEELLDCLHIDLAQNAGELDPVDRLRRWSAELTTWIGKERNTDAGAHLCLA